MTSFLDTSVAVRYLTGDPPSMYEDAIRIVEGVDELFFTDSAIAETGHVLDSFYHVARADIVDSLMTLLQHRNIRPFGLDKALVLTVMFATASARWAPSAGTCSGRSFTT